MKNKDENNCENCAHFVRHYIKTSSAQISSIHCGHCLDHQLSAKERRSFPLINECPYWQPKEIADIKKLQSIRESMQIIAHRLDEIALVLKDKIDEV